MAGRRAPGDRPARPVDSPDVRGLGRGSGPDAGRRLRPAPGGSQQAEREAAVAPHQGRVLTATRHVLPRRAGVGMDPAAVQPARALATPRSVQALLGPNPRVIADDVWAKLLWAGLNLEPEDCPTNTYGLCYPMEMIRAITLAWLFSGLRSDEIARLRVGCVRWQHDGMPIPGDSGEVLARDAVLPARHPDPQDGHRLHQARRPAARQGHRGMAVHPRPPSRRCSTARPASTSTSCSRIARSAWPRPTSTPRSSPRSAARPPSRPPTSAGTSPATAPAPPSPPSSTTPRSR